MKRISLILCLALTGCVSPAGQGSRLLPWNWFHPDTNAALLKAAAEKAKADAAAIHAAHVETDKAEEALSYAPPSPPVDFARRTLAGGNGLLAQVAALNAEQRAISHQIVMDLFSGIPAKLEAANRKQTQIEAENVKVSRVQVKRAEAVADAQTDVAASNVENSGDAATLRKWKFWIFVVVGGWALLQLLSGLSRFWPTLAPIARVAGFLSAPAVQAGYERVTRAVSTVITDARKSSKETGETLRNHLDGPLDDVDKRLIRAKVKAAEEKAEA